MFKTNKANSIKNAFWSSKKAQLAVQVWNPEFNTQKSNKKVRHDTDTCNSRDRETEGEKSTSLAKSASSRPVGHLVSQPKKQIGK